MTITSETGVYYDPYDLKIHADPYPTFRRLREESPLYFNDDHGFYALSRFNDVEKGLVDHATFSSAHGVILEMIKADPTLPQGVFICEDPPAHSAHRGLLARVFTPKKMNALEPQIREFCAHALDPLVGSGGFGFLNAFGTPMRVRGLLMLLGTQEQENQGVREHGNDRLHREPAQPADYTEYDIADPTFFGD